MAVALDTYIGSTRVIIDDEYCKDTTPEQVKEILARCGQIVYQDQQAKLFREKHPDLL